MGPAFLRKLLLPIGPAISLSLLGLLLMSVLLYYRAVNIQRFLEPALAMSQPRVTFSENMKKLVVKEFGREPKGLVFTTDAIFIEESLLYISAHHQKQSKVIQRIARVFRAALADPEMQSYIDIVMVGARLPISSDSALNRKNRADVQHKAEFLLNALYSAEPGLQKYETYFVAAVVPVDGHKTQPNWIEFRIIPTLRLHIDVLQKLQKYTR